MKRLFLVLWLAAAPLRAADPPADADSPPRLVVVVVVDQFRSDFLDRLPRNGRFRASLQNAAVFPNTIHDHVPTETAPGHASLSTGRPPSVHGITGNDYFDRALGRTIVFVDGPDGKKGPQRLEAPTIGDALKVASPRSRVVSLSLKDRSAIYLGGRRADVAIWYDRNQRAFVSSSFYPALPGWVATAQLRAPTAEPPFMAQDPMASPAGDRLLLNLALAALRGEELGADENCDMLFVGFSAMDYIGHRWGPDSRQMTLELEAMDETLADLLAAADAASGGRYLFVLSSDHGSLPVPGTPAGDAVNARRVPKAAFVRRMESLLPPNGKIRRWNNPEIFLEAGANRAWLAQAQAALVKDPDIAAVYIAGASAPGDPYEPIFRRSFYPGRSGDLQVRLEPGALIDPGEGTSHGTVYDYDARVPLVFIGPAVRSGIDRRRISVESLAPTLADWLRVALPGQESRPALDVLRAPAESAR